MLRCTKRNKKKTLNMMKKRLSTKNVKNQLHKTSQSRRRQITRLPRQLQKKTNGTQHLSSVKKIQKCFRRTTTTRRLTKALIQTCRHRFHTA